MPFPIESAYGRRSWLRIALILVLLQASVSWADSGTLNSWRHQLSRTQRLAENDVSSALQEAQRLQLQLPADASPADHAQVLNLLSRIENYKLETEHAIAHAQQAQALAAQYKDRIDQAEADLNLALGKTRWGQLDHLDELILHCTELLEGSNRPDLLSEAMGMAALIYLRKGMFDDAKRTVDIARQSGDTVALAYAHWSGARLFTSSDSSKVGLRLAMDMYEHARLANNLRLQSAALVEWGSILGSDGDYTGGEQRIREAINIARRTGMSAGLGIGLYALAENLHMQGKITAAVTVLDELVALYEKHPHRTGLWWALYVRSGYAQELGRNGEADAEHAWRLAEEIGMPLYLVKSAQRLAAIDVSRHDWKHAYEHTAKVSEMLERAAGDGSGARLTMLAKHFEEDSKRRRIEALARENERQQAQQRWMLMMTLLGGASVFIAGMLLFLAQQRRVNRRLAEINRQLKFSRDQLWESEWLLSNLAMHVPGFVYTYRLGPDGYGSFPYTSPGIRELLDLSPADVRDDMMPLHLRMHADDRPKIEAALAESAANLSEFHVEVRALNPAKGEKWVEIRSTPVRMPDGSILYYGIMTDITQRKSMEVLLQVGEHRYRTLVENLPDAVVRYDRNYRRILANSAFYRTSGLTEEDAIGNSPIETGVAWPSNIGLDAYQEYLRSVMETGQAANVLLISSYPGNASNQYFAYYDYRLVPEYAPDGRLIGVLGIGHDVSELKNMHIQLQESQTMLRALVERNESIREAERRHLAREVHDELGQMLNAVRLNLIVLERRFGRENPEMRGMVGTMLEHLGNTIAIARNIVLALHPTVLDAGIALALDWLVREFDRSAGIACHLAVDQGIALDESQSMVVFRIVQESLTNVARHSGASWVEVVLVQDEAMYRLEISDNGRGFDVSLPRTRKSLGLIGMRERVFMLGGALDLTSTPGEGTVVRIAFPVIQIKEEIQ